MRLKGLNLPSWQNQSRSIGPSGQAGPHRALPQGMQYTAFTGRKAALRYLKQNCRDITKSKDPVIIEVFNLVEQAIPNEYQMYQLFYRAKQIMVEHDMTLLDSVNLLLIKFEELKDKKNDGNSDRGVIEGAVGETN